LLCLFLSCFFIGNFPCIFFLFVFLFQLPNTLICNIQSIGIPCLLKMASFELCSSLF
jgi:hypothetical protein